MIATLSPTLGVNSNFHVNPILSKIATSIDPLPRASDAQDPSNDISLADIHLTFFIPTNRVVPHTHEDDDRPFRAQDHHQIEADPSIWLDLEANPLTHRVNRATEWTPVSPFS